MKPAQVEKNPVRCPDQEMAEQMFQLIDQVRKDGDSVGGIVDCIIRNVPPGIGTPVFDRLEADLAKAMLSIPATKGFEIGSGFGAALMKGSEHNDLFYSSKGTVHTKTIFFRRDSGRNHQWGNDPFPGGVQTNCDYSASLKKTITSDLKRHGFETQGTP